MEGRKEETVLEHGRRQFLNPGAEYTPIPFWFWNDDLNRDELLRQMHEFKAKEVEGFVIHPRMGLPRSIGYMSETYLDLVEMVVREAANLGMKVVLYDEGMYPSGSACGQIVKRNEQLASRGLRMVEYPIGPGTANGKPIQWKPPLEPGDRIVSVQAIRKIGDNRVDLSQTRLLQDKGGKVEFVPPYSDASWSLVAFIDSFSYGTIRGIHFGQDDGEPEAPRSADLLNPEAVRLFIELTHEKYARRLGDYFGTTIIAMFTDEPDLLGRRHRKGMLPWTNLFLADFIAAGNREEDLAALWFDAGQETAGIRQRYRKAVGKRMERVYYKPLSEWCEAHGIALTGHPAGSDDIGLLKYFHIPGQDVVWRFIGPEDGKGITGNQSSVGKCSSDAARHAGRRRNLNEVFGVCGRNRGWDLTADDIKWYLDWLFVRGVNLICPHAFYYSIEGPRLHERAPDVGLHNIWWSEFARFSRYIKRMSWAMTDSVNVTGLAVLCQHDRLPWKLAKPLFERQLEFNYLEEERLCNDVVIENGKAVIRNQRYDTIVLDAEERFEEETWRKLDQFVRSGGAVLEWTAGGGLTNRPDIGQRRFAELDELVDALAERLAGIPRITPASTDIRISHVVKDGLHLYLITNEGEQPYTGRLRVPERGRTERWDAWNGITVPAQAVSVDGQNGGLSILLELQRRESVLFAIDPGSPIEELSAKSSRLVKQLDLSDQWRMDGQPVLLESWTRWDGMERFSGTRTYSTDWRLEPGTDYDRAILDLGEVHELARVRVNGREAGVGMWRPYRFDLTDSLQIGTNRIEVDVTNSLANRHDGLSLPSGLLGPVTITFYKEE